MGKRTVHQIDAKAQLVVVATRERLGGAPVAVAAAAAATGDAAAADAGDMEVEALGIIPSEKPSVDPSDPGAKETAGLTTDEDVFVAPVIVEESGKVWRGGDARGACLSSCGTELITLLQGKRR